MNTFPARCPWTPSSAWMVVIGVLAGLLTSVSRSGAQALAPAPATTSTLKRMSLQELMDLEVTSVSRRPERLVETPSAIQVVTNEDIRRSGAGNIPEALRLATNLHVGQRGSHAWNISARGFNTELGNKLLVLIDGRSVYTPLYSGVFWDRQDTLLEDVDRIEVISGPGGTLWGANAVNGVINITTKSAADTHGTFVEVGTGSTLRTTFAARYGGTLAPDVHFRVYGKYFDRDGAVFENGNRAPDSWQMGQGGFRLDAATAGGNEFTLQGDFYGGDQGVVAGGRSTVAGGNILGRWSRRLANDSDIDLQVYYDRTHLATPIAALVINGTQFAPAGTLVDDLHTYDVDFQHRINAAGGHRIVWGLGYRFIQDRLQNAPAVAFLPPSLDQSLLSGFVQDEIKLGDFVSVTLGSKLEHNDYTGWEAEPGVRLEWNPQPGHTVWAAVSRAVRAPSRIDRDLSQPAPQFIVVLAGGPEFASETVTAYELGYRAHADSKLITAVSAFFNDYDDVRSTTFTPATILPLFFANDLEGETYGVEVSANYQLTERSRLHLGYTFLHGDIRLKPGAVDINNALNETADPRHQWSLRYSVELLRAVGLDAGLRWVDSFVINNGGVAASVGDYTELDVRLVWHVSERMELSLVGQNLLHDRHLEYGPPGPAREEIERSVHGKATWRF